MVPAGNRLKPLFSQSTISQKQVNLCMHFCLSLIQEKLIKSGLIPFAVTPLIIESGATLLTFSEGESKSLRISNIDIPMLYITTLVHFLSDLTSSGAINERVVLKKQQHYFHMILVLCHQIPKLSSITKVV